MNCTDIGKLLLIIKYRNYGVCLSYLLDYFHMSSSSFYFKTRLFFVVDTIKVKPKQKRFVGFSYTIDGQIVEDERIKQIIISIYSNSNPNDPTFYFKSLGDKKLSVVFKNQLGIIVNHKKIYRLRKELGFVRPYRNHFKHPKRRPSNHEIDAPNRFWEGDIKFIPTTKDGFVPILDIIDAFDKTIVSSQIGHSSKSKDFIKSVYNGISYRKADPKKLIIRTDNGPQFKSKATKSFMDEMEITHEFGYKNNPNSQAFIESHHSSLEREFVQLNSFENIEDVFQAYNAYMFFYHNLRPHGSLNYMTPSEFSRIFSDDNNCFNFKTIFVKK